MQATTPHTLPAYGCGLPGHGMRTGTCPACQRASKLRQAAHLAAAQAAGRAWVTGMRQAAQR